MVLFKLFEKALIFFFKTCYRLLVSYPIKFLGKFWYLILLFVLLTILSCGKAKDQPEIEKNRRAIPIAMEDWLRQPKLYPKIEFPDSLETLSINDIPLSCYDNSSHFVTQLAEKWHRHLESTINASNGEVKITLPSIEEVERLVANEFEVLDNHPWCPKLQQLVDDLKPFAHLEHLQIEVRIVKNLDGSGYHNTFVYPGMIVMGEARLDTLLKYNIHSLLNTLAHELGHLYINSHFHSIREQLWIKGYSERLGKVGRFVTGSFVNAVDDPFQKREEYLADLAAILILNNTQRVHLLKAMKARQAEALEAEKLGYQSATFSTHPNEAHRAACLTNYIIQNIQS